MPSAHPAIGQVAGKKLKFAILVTGNSAPEIEKEFGDYGQLYKDLLADPDLDEEWHVFYPVNNQFPTDDDLQGFKVPDLLLHHLKAACSLSSIESPSHDTNLVLMQAIILTGSKHDAYATDEWNLKLRELIKTAHHRQQRISGSLLWVSDHYHSARRHSR